ncbi:Tyrosine-protein kinase isoform SRK4 [Leucoagaricus sp. SymC.cos]|nr:Tyrosine-protein kinase isoform SRK4 [Leucoagaricus sp. SymC.cos]
MHSLFAPQTKFSDIGKGTELRWASYEPGYREETSTALTWITTLIRAIQLALKDRSSPTHVELSPPSPGVTRELLSLLLQLWPNKFDRIRSLPNPDIQEIRDFVLFALNELLLLEQSEIDAFCSLLEFQQPPVQPVFPRNIVLHGIVREQRPKKYNRADFCVKIVKPGVSKYLPKASSQEIIKRIRVDHKNILPFYGVYSLKEGPAIVTPWMKWNLQEYVEQHNELEDRAPLIFDVVGGLAYLHNSGIVHGNLKSENVLVSQSQKAMLADFESYVDHIAGGREKSSDRWKAPEIINGSSPTKESDVWSFGCIAYYITSGLLPFWKHNDARVRYEIHWLNELPYGREDRVGAFPGKSLMEDCWKPLPEDRPNSWTSIHQQVALFAKRADSVTQRQNEDAKSTLLWHEAKAKARVGFDAQRVHNSLLACQNKQAVVRR